MSSVSCVIYRASGTTLTADFEFTIPNIAILNPQILSPNAGRLPIEVASDQLTTFGGNHRGKDPVGKISNESHVDILRQMQNHSCLRLQMYCQVEQRYIGRYQAQKSIHTQCELSVIVYGPGTVSDKVGDYLQAHGIYLQDPEHCDCIVPYTNPHCLSTLEDDILMTSSRQRPASTEQGFRDPSGIFDSLSCVTDLEETDTPSVLNTTLKR